MNGKARAMVARRVSCMRCLGKGRYILQHPPGTCDMDRWHRHEIDPCPVCDGTGREPGR